MICFYSLINLHLRMYIYAHNVEIKHLFTPYMEASVNIFMGIEVLLTEAQGTLAKDWQLWERSHYSLLSINKKTFSHFQNIMWWCRQFCLFGENKQNLWYLKLIGFEPWTFLFPTRHSRILKNYRIWWHHWKLLYWVLKIVFPLLILHLTFHYPISMIYISILNRCNTF